MLIMPMLLLVVTPNTAYANNNKSDEDPVAKGPACEYTVTYQETSTSRDKPYDLETHRATNQTSAAQNMTVSYSTTRTFTGNVSLSAERDVIMWKIGGKAEIGFGRTETKTFTATTNVPAYTTFYCEVGSLLTTTNGKLNYVNTDCTKSSKSVNLEFTTGRHVRWYE